jgi:hypothetical protein
VLLAGPAPHRQDLSDPRGAARLRRKGALTAYVDCLGATDIRGLGERLVDALARERLRCGAELRAGEGDRRRDAADGEGPLRARRAGTRSRAREERAALLRRRARAAAHPRAPVPESALSSSSTSSRRPAVSDRGCST